MSQLTVIISIVILVLYGLFYFGNNRTRPITMIAIIIAIGLLILFSFKK